MTTPTFRWPVGPGWHVTQPFGCTGFYLEPPLGSCAHFHRGLDLADGTCGSDILAAAAGTVHFSGRQANGSETVTIDHGGGWFTDSEHLETRTVVTGQKVAAGQKIGTEGSTGVSTGCHLFFAIKGGVNGALNVLSDSNGTWQDPEKLLPAYGGAGVAIYEKVSTQGGKLVVPTGVKVNGLQPGDTWTTVKTATGPWSGTFDFALHRIGGTEPPTLALHMLTGPLAGLYVNAGAGTVTYNPVPVVVTQADVDAAKAEGYAEAKAAAIAAVQKI